MSTSPQPPNEPSVASFLRRVLRWTLRWALLGLVLGAALSWMPTLDEGFRNVLFRRLFLGASVGGLVGTAGGVVDSWRRVRRGPLIWVLGLLILGISLAALAWLLLPFFRVP